MPGTGIGAACPAHLLLPGTRGRVPPGTPCRDTQRTAAHCHDLGASTGEETASGDADLPAFPGSDDDQRSYFSVGDAPLRRALTPDPG